MKKTASMKSRSIHEKLGTNEAGEQKVEARVTDFACVFHHPVCAWQTWQAAFFIRQWS
ncbi:unnamed protein product [Amoebophrya sp. A120]|nr:unnamed protein product [Amoebophrya sp. A120]|eukprot:GSA120T00025492001.1